MPLAELDTSAHVEGGVTGNACKKRRWLKVRAENSPLYLLKGLAGRNQKIVGGSEHSVCATIHKPARGRAVCEEGGDAARGAPRSRAAVGQVYARKTRLSISRVHVRLDPEAAARRSVANFEPAIGRGRSVFGLG